MKYLFTPIFLYILFVSSLNAQTLDDYVDQLSSHPEVLTLVSKSKKYYELAESELSWPDPMVVLGVDNVPVDSFAFDDFLPTSKYIGFKQDIPNYSYRKANSDRQLESSHKNDLIAHYLKSKLKAKLISMLVEYEKINKQIYYSNQKLKLYKELENYYKGQLDAGKPVYPRFSEIDIERTTVEQQLNEFIAKKEIVIAEFIRLVDEVPQIKIRNLTQNKYSHLESVYPIEITKRNVLISQHKISAAKAEYYPDYSTKFVYKQREDGPGFTGEDWFSFEIMLSIPLWYHTNQDPKLRAAKAEKQSSLDNLENIKRNWVKFFSAMNSQIQEARNNIHLLNEKLTSLNELVDALSRNYESGKNNLDTVIHAKINLLSIHILLESQKAKHFSLIAEYNSHIIGN